MQAVLIVKEIH